MLFSAEQAFVGRDETRAPLKTPAWEVTLISDNQSIKKITSSSPLRKVKLVYESNSDGSKIVITF